MAMKDFVSKGIGFTPGSMRFFITKGLTIGGAAAVLLDVIAVTVFINQTASATAHIDQTAEATTFINQGVSAVTYIDKNRKVTVNG